jgi:predicted nucleic acid-binding protein
MKTVVLDSHALLTYFEKQDGWQAVANLLAEGGQETARLLLSTVNWGEVLYITRRVYGPDDEDAVCQALDDLPVALVSATRERVRAAARLKAEGGMAYADCFAAGLALDEGALLATGDPEFAGVADRIDIRWVPSGADPSS